MFDSPENDQLFNYTLETPPKIVKFLEPKKKLSQIFRHKISM